MTLSAGVLTVGPSTTSQLIIDQSTGNINNLQIRGTGSVAHGLTQIATTATFFQAAVANTGLGGAFLDTVAESGLYNVMNLRSFAVSTDTTKSTAALGSVQLHCYQHDGANGLQNVDANGNLFAVRVQAGGAQTTRFILDADGDSHQDVGTAWTNFRDHDDLALVELLSANVTRRDDPIRSRFGAILAQNRDELEELGLVSFNDGGPGQDGHPFVNMSKLTMLLVGALIQTGARLKKLEGATALQGPIGGLE